MAPTSQQSSASVMERSLSEIVWKGLQMGRVRLECSNPQGSGLQKLTANDHIVRMLNTVENAVQNCHRAWEWKLPQEFRSTKFCKIDLPSAWRWKGRQCNEQGKPVRTAVLSTSMSTFQGATAANAGYVAENGSQDMEHAEAHFRVPDFPGFDTLISKHPLALVSFVPRELALFFAGAVAGAGAKTVTAPLDRVKLLMQVHGKRMAQEGSKKGIGLLEIIRVVPYSAVQLFAYETDKRLFKGDNDELAVVGRLAAGACAGMTSTLMTYPLDVLRLRLAVDSTARSMGQVAGTMLREEGLKSFYKGLGPSLLGIAPYIALNFCVFDLVKKSLPEDFRRKPEALFMTALLSASFATAMCYPLDTARRQMQMRGSPFNSFLDAIPGIIARDGFFVPNVLKNLPNSSIRLTTFDAAKNFITASQAEYQKVLEEHQKSFTNSETYTASVSNHFSSNCSCGIVSSHSHCSIKDPPIVGSIFLQATIYSINGDTDIRVTR